jgi:hypothetical protein
MKPDVATVLVNKLLKCPKNGMPEAFYIDGRFPKSLSTRQTNMFRIGKTVVSRVLIPALAVGATWGLKMLLDGPEKQSTSFPRKMGKSIKKKKRATIKSSKIRSNASKRQLKGKKAKKEQQIIISKQPDSPITHSSASAANLISSSSEPRSIREKEQQGSTVPKVPLEKIASLQSTKLTKDLDKTWVDRVVSMTLEKLDDLFKRPF